MAGFERRAKRYPTDLTDEEWRFIQPFLPSVPKRGRKPKTHLREDREEDLAPQLRHALQPGLEPLEPTHARAPKILARNSSHSELVSAYWLSQ